MISTMLKRTRRGLFQLLLVVLFNQNVWTDALQSSANPRRPGIPERNPAEQIDTVGSSAVGGLDFVQSIRRYRKTRGKETTPETTTPRKEITPETTTPRKDEGPQSKKTTTFKPKAKRVTIKPSTALSYESTITVLRAYFSKHSDLVLPRKFIVPEDEGYPSVWHGIDLAGTVYDMRWWQQHVKQKPERVAELNKLGFVWERLQPGWNLILEALITYSSLHGDLLVPSTFVVPHGDNNWTKATWGLTLGRSVHRIRTRGDFLKGSTTWSRRDQLDALGFVWDVQEQLFRKFYIALYTFARLEAQRDGVKQKSTLRVPSIFLIPSTDDWRKELWGYRLGEKCTAVRQKGLYIKNDPERQQMLVEIGFIPSGNASLGWLKVVHAAAIYSQMNNRNLNVPQKFIVPAPPRRNSTNSSSESSIVGSDDAWPWPEHLWGFPLGLRLKDVRLKGAYLKGEGAEGRRLQLNTLGFVWNPRPGRQSSGAFDPKEYPELQEVVEEVGLIQSGLGSQTWQKIIHAAAIYARMNNRILDVSRDFVVPAPERRISKDSSSENITVGGYDPWPWPEHLWEFPLGRRLNSIRSNGAHLKGESAEARRRQLDRLGFKWDPEPEPKMAS